VLVLHRLRGTKHKALWTASDQQRLGDRLHGSNYIVCNVLSYT